MKSLARAIVVFAVALFALGATAPAFACPVCFGASDDPMAAGMNNGIFFLLGVIGMVQVGFVALFISFRRRGQAYQEHKESFEVINGGVR